MPRPKNKTQLLELSKANFQKLLAKIDHLSPEERSSEFSHDSLYRNVRDVLAHLHHWHVLFLGWYEIGMKGQKPDMPAEGYSWKTVPLLNKAIHQKYKKSSLNEVRTAFESSFKNIDQIIEQHTEEELFEKRRYKRTGTTSLASYLISASSSHYDWAIRFLKKSLAN